MIRITCTNCKAQLSIDEAFAGGACRCQYCGTIQTVPKHLKNGAAPQGVKASTGPRKPTAAPQRSKVKADMGLSSGLDAIAEVVASSGLSGSGLRSNPPRRRTLAEDETEPHPQPSGSQLPLVLLGAGAVIVLLLGLVIGLLLKHNAGPATSGDPTQRNDAPDSAPAPPSEPHVATVTPAVPITGNSFLGIPVVEPSVIFVLDRGNATHASFDAMKLSCMNVIGALKPDQTFQIVFWKLDREQEPVILPDRLLRAGEKAEIKKLDQSLEEMTSFGQTELAPALEKAFATGAGTLIIATAKPIDESFVATVMDARKNSGTKVHCLSLAEPSSEKAMREVAQKTGGTYKLVSVTELQSIAR